MSSKSAPTRFSLRRWSQRKLETARAGVPTPSQTSPAVGASGLSEASAKTAHGALEAAGSTTVSIQSASAELPAIDSLTIDSDFAPFFKPQVDESIKRAALKQLFRDPRFNVMDGLDTYIGDYTQPDPIPAAMLEDLMQRRVFFPLSTPEKDPAERVVDERAGDQRAPHAEAIAAPIAAIPPVAQAAQIAPVVPVAPSAAAIPATPEAEPETGADAKSGKS